MLKWSIFPVMSLLMVACMNNTDDIAKIESSADIELWKKAVTYLEPLDKQAYLDQLDIDEDKLALGEKLFHDKRLSFKQTQSCNTCHNLKTYGVDNEQLSLGDAGELGRRNAPSVVNATLHFAQFWDGRAKDLKEQAAVPILNPEEMAIPNEQFLVDRLSKDPIYQKQFEQVYNTPNALTFEHITDALAAFEQTLISSSRLDQYLLGDRTVLNDLEKEGLNAFIDLGCSPCHSGQAVGGEMMHRFGLQSYYWDQTNSGEVDQGKFLLSQKEEDKFVFKVPSLRNVTKTYPYFHDGSVQTIEEAVETMAKLQLNYDIKENEVLAIVAFLNTLVGDSGKF